MCSIFIIPVVRSDKMVQNYITAGNDIDALCVEVYSTMKISQTSGVAGREPMETAFPHKKLSGNGVPTREILRDIF